MNTSKTFAAALIAALLASTALYAEPQAAASLPQMVSGGIGDTGMDDIAAAQKHYSLKLVFTETSGEYLADVGVLIRDRSGNVVVNSISQGPIALINLKPGIYTLSSKGESETKTQRVVVHGRGLNTYYIHLHSA